MVDVDFGENWVSVDPAADYDDTVGAIQRAVDGYPGLYRDVQAYLKERVREVLTDASQAIVIRMSGDDLGVLRGKAEEVQDALEPVDGLVDLHAELQAEVPHIEVEVVVAAAARHGVKPGDARRAAAAVMQGIEVNDIWQPARVFDVNVWSVPRARHSLSSLRVMPIDTPDGGHVASVRSRASASRRRRTRSSARTCRAGSTSAPTSPPNRDIGSDRRRRRKAARVG